MKMGWIEKRDKNLHYPIDINDILSNHIKSYLIDRIDNEEKEKYHIPPKPKYIHENEWSDYGCQYGYVEDYIRIYFRIISKKIVVVKDPNNITDPAKKIDEDIFNFYQPIYRQCMKNDHDKYGFCNNHAHMAYSEFYKCEICGKVYKDENEPRYYREEIKPTDKVELDYLREYNHEPGKFYYRCSEKKCRDINWYWTKMHRRWKKDLLKLDHLSRINYLLAKYLNHTAIKIRKTA